MNEIDSKERLARAEELLKEMLRQDLLTDVTPGGGVYCTLCGAEQPDSVGFSQVKRVRVERAEHTAKCPITKIKNYFSY